MKTTAFLAAPVLAAAAFLPALTEASRPVDAPAPAAEAPARFAIDTAHSWILFKVNHLGIGTAWGSFSSFEGAFTLDAEDLSGSSVELSLDAASVTTNNKKRDDHLRGPDFFNAKEFPQVRFRSTAVEGSADAFHVTGVISLLGKEQEVVAELKKVGEGGDPWGNHRAGFEGRFTLDRTAFGMDYMKEGLGTEVEVILAFEGVREK
jgi:polyisoprenoid-binding protein YceI